MWPPGNPPLHLLPTWWGRLEYSRKEGMKTLICENYGGSGDYPRCQRIPQGRDGRGLLAEVPAFFRGPSVGQRVPLVASRCRTPFRWSPPYRCAPPKDAIFRKINELLEQGVIRPSKSPYASPAFIIPNSGGDFRMMYYRMVNAKVVFDSYPMPTIDQAFEQFGGRCMVLGLGLGLLSDPLFRKESADHRFLYPIRPV